MVYPSLSHFPGLSPGISYSRWTCVVFRFLSVAQRKAQRYSRVLCVRGQFYHRIAILYGVQYCCGPHQLSENEYPIQYRKGSLLFGKTRRTAWDDWSACQLPAAARIRSAHHALTLQPGHLVRSSWQITNLFHSELHWG